MATSGRIGTKIRRLPQNGFTKETNEPKNPCATKRTFGGMERHGGMSTEAPTDDGAAHVPPIDRLPTELMVAIFDLVAALEDCRMRRRTLMPVCRRWDSIVRNGDPCRHDLGALARDHALCFDPSAYQGFRLPVFERLCDACAEAGAARCLERVLATFKQEIDRRNLDRIARLAVVVAGEKGHINVLEVLMWQSGMRAFTNDFMCATIEHRRWGVYTWLLDRSAVDFQLDVCRIVRTGDADALRRVLNHHNAGSYALRQGWYTQAVLKAGVDMLDALLEHGCPLGDIDGKVDTGDKPLIDLALSCSRPIEIVWWLRRHGASWTLDSMALAASRYDTADLDALLCDGCPWVPGSQRWTVPMGHRTRALLEWARRRGLCFPPWTDSTVYHCIAGDQVPMLEWYRTHSDLNLRLVAYLSQFVGVPHPHTDAWLERHLPHAGTAATATQRAQVDG
jgi:hypothetical protein